MRMRDKGMLFEDDGKQPRLRFKDEDNTVAYVNMPAKGEKNLPSLLLRMPPQNSIVGNLDMPFFIAVQLRVCSWRRSHNSYESVLACCLTVNSYEALLENTLRLR
jgi:hypothetical protein